MYSIKKISTADPLINLKIKRNEILKKILCDHIEYSQKKKEFLDVYIDLVKRKIVKLDEITQVELSQIGEYTDFNAERVAELTNIFNEEIDSDKLETLQESLDFIAANSKKTIDEFNLINSQIPNTIEAINYKLIYKTGVNCGSESMLATSI